MKIRRLAFLAAILTLATTVYAGSAVHKTAVDERHRPLLERDTTPAKLVTKYGVNARDWLYSRQNPYLDSADFSAVYDVATKTALVPRRYWQVTQVGEDWVVVEKNQAGKDAADAAAVPLDAATALASARTELERLTTAILVAQQCANYLGASGKDTAYYDGQVTSLGLERAALLGSFPAAP